LEIIRITRKKRDKEGNGVPTTSSQEHIISKTKSGLSIKQNSLVLQTPDVSSEGGGDDTEIDDDQLISDQI
jgi:hypothetical protein